MQRWQSVKHWRSLALMLLALAAVPLRPAAQAQNPQPQAAAPPYIPQAKFCANGGNGLCAIVPAYIGPDPGLKQTQGYNGLYGQPPQNEKADVQSPFDNMSWQMFVALNWVAGGVTQPAAQGLTQPGRRVWQTYPTVSSLFGNAPVITGCTQALALPIFHIGSNGQGQPMPNNEEYLQAATNKPLIDINGNWTLFERRVNETEAQYLRAPGGQKSQTLTTKAGQLNFIKNNPGGAEFTSSATVPDGTNGSIEIKASWRILDPAKDDPTKFFTQNILLAVSGDLVRDGRPFCRSERVGLVGMHILQRNPLDKNNPALRPQWIWSTFEHVDNAPLATSPCNVADGCGTDKATNWINQPSCGPASPAPGSHFSFFDTGAPSSLGTNVAPQPPGVGKTAFPWNSRKPYAKGGTTGATAMPQAVRCWRIYPTTSALNEQWRMALGSLKSVFQNYMLVGTQWGGNVEPPTPPNPIPSDAVPGMLSNMTLETYIQNYLSNAAAGPGSCVSCHSFATLADGKTSANFSFLPGIVDAASVRAKIKTAP